ncbi:MAG TPA: hypothetical protein VMH28_15050 [Candidatus Acidoferrales bacterium]|nr:hypothetical protein [Candidatus Acidoferrales bacterium]
MRLFFRSVLLILVLYGLVFAVGDAYLSRHGAPVWVALLFAVAIVGLQYWLGPYLGATGAPDALDTALVKIAYGIFQADGELAAALENAAKGEKAWLQHARGRVGSMALTGISNLRAGQSMALAGADGSGAAAIMRWDRVNPWGRVYELNSTHPLTAMRIRALNRESEAMHQSISHPLANGNRICGWGAFPLEALLWAAPWVCGIGAVLTGAITQFADGAAPLPAALGPALLITAGVTWMLRTAMRYRGTLHPATIASLMEEVDVSEMRPRAVRLEGTIVGFGVPGAFWCADLVIRDSTGILFMLYKQSIPLARIMFAVTAAAGYIGQRVTIEGWFRRGIRPYVEMGRLTGEDGKAQVAWSRWVHYLAAAIVAVLGAIWSAVRQ